MTTPATPEPSATPPSVSVQSDGNSGKSDGNSSPSTEQRLLAATRNDFRRFAGWFGAFGLGTKLVMLAFAALLVFGGVKTCQLDRALAAGGQAALAGSNAKAAADTSHVTPLSARDVARILGDTLAARSRLVVQQPQRSDALDRALHEDRLALAQLTATVAQLAAHIVSTASVVQDTGAGGQGTRHATFDVRQAPYTAHASVDLPAPPGRGAIDLRVQLDTAHVALRLGCGKADKFGIRPATATVTGPTWLALSLSHVEQSADQCHSPALEPRRAFSWLPRWLPQPDVTAGPACVLDTKLHPTCGAGITLGFRLWP